MKRFGIFLIQPFLRLISLYGNLFKLLGPKDSRKTLALVVGIWAGMVIFPASSKWLDLGIFDGISGYVQEIQTPDSRVVILGLDADTLEDFPEKWPWSRAIYAELLKLVLKESPRGVVWCFPLPASDREIAEGDRIFAETLKGSDSVILARLQAIEAEQKEEDDLIAPLYRDLPRLNVIGVRDADECIRRVRIAFFQETGSLVRLPDWNVLQFPEKGGQIPSYGIKVRDGKFALSVDLKDRWVFLGPTVPILHDFWPTTQGLTPGVRVLATAWENGLSNRFLRFKEGKGPRLFCSAFGAYLGLLWMSLSPWKPLVVSLLSAFPLTMFLSLAAITAGFFPPLGLLMVSWIFTACLVVAFESFYQYVYFQTMAEEGRAVAKLHQTIFPEKAWESPVGFRCEGFCLPCEDAGGDFFDFFEQKDKSFFLFLGDVSGHGYPAGMVTMMAKALLAILTKESVIDPPSVFAALNALLLKIMKKERAMTAVSAILNQETRELSISFAGHAPPILVTETGVLSTLSTPSFLLGIRSKLPREKIVTRKISLNPGDHLIFYTDGITEARNWQDELFGMDSWENFIDEHLIKMTPSEFYKKTLETLREFSRNRPFEDDVTMMVFSYRPPPPAPDFKEQANA